MISTRRLCAFLLLLAPASIAAPLALATNEGTDAPMATLLAELTEDERVYNDHVVTLASPFMEGRVPGSRGMQIATEYMEYWFEHAGVEPAFDRIEEAADGSEVRTPRASWRQPFELSGTRELVDQGFVLAGHEAAFEAGVDYQALSVGSSGEARAGLAFVGYSIVRGGKNKFSSFGEVKDLEGRIAVMFRFEPVAESGWSQWRDNEGWSARASFNGKIRAVMKLKPAGIVIINPPGTADERAKQLTPFASAGRSAADVPVFMLTTEAGERFVEACDPEGRSLMDLRKLADEGSGVIDLSGELSLRTQIEKHPLVAENVGGLLPGRGGLADEYIVIGAHLDHLGMGNFGSRAESTERGKLLHPGADDNASGSAAILMLAQKLKRAYDALPDDAEARSILFIGFSAEESGLNGSRHYANNPLVPAEQHALMINFDMIGRIENGRLSVSGSKTGDGMEEWLQPFFERSSLEIVQPANMSGASDHTPFYQKKIPVLFGIIADFHDDYHTPRDVSTKINRRGAVHTVHLFEEIALGAATRPERFEYREVQRRRRGQRAQAEGAEGAEKPAEKPAGEGVAEAEPPAPTRGGIRVRFGIRPSSYDDAEAGIPVGGLTEGGSAEKAGVKTGDRLIKWNGKEIEGVREWMGMLGEHDPGDKVQVTVLRDGEEVTLWVTLQGTEEEDA